MHRDHKLALALALLLIGVAAALCFPKQQPADLALLELENTEQLDAALDLLPVRVYTESHPKPSTSAESAGDADERPAPASDLSDPFTGFPLLPAAPDPIPNTDEADNGSDGQLLPAPSESIVVGEWPASNEPQPDVTETSREDVLPFAEPLVYEVQPGDTLSDLAGRFLGSTRRFLELYQANRSVLASPDDLRVGMRLTIPGRSVGEGTGSVRVAEAPPETADTTPAPSAVGDNAPSPPSNRQTPVAPPRFRSARTPFQSPPPDRGSRGEPEGVSPRRQDPGD